MRLILGKNCALQFNRFECHHNLCRNLTKRLSILGNHDDVDSRISFRWVQLSL